MIKSTRNRWAAHVARMLEEELHARVWWGNLRERDHLEDICVVGRIILKGNIKKLVTKIDLDEDRDRWRALVIAVTNLQVP